MVNRRKLRRLDRDFLNLLEFYRIEYNNFCDNDVKASGVRCIQSLAQIMTLCNYMKKEIRYVRSQIKHTKKMKKQHDEDEKNNTSVVPQIIQNTCLVDGALILY